MIVPFGESLKILFILLGIERAKNLHKLPILNNAIIILVQFIEQV